MQAALHTGIHRCSNDGQTLDRTEGEILPSCSCGQGTWEFLATDNNRDPIPLLVGKGIIHVTEIDEVPEVGTTFNFRGGIMKPGIYRVSKLDEMRWGGKDNVHVDVEKVGEFNPALPIYPVASINC